MNNTRPKRRRKSSWWQKKAVIMLLIALIREVPDILREVGQMLG